MWARQPSRHILTHTDSGTQAFSNTWHNQSALEALLTLHVQLAQSTAWRMEDGCAVFRQGLGAMPPTTTRLGQTSARGKRLSEMWTKHKHCASELRAACRGSHLHFRAATSVHLFRKNIEREEQDRNPSCQPHGTSEGCEKRGHCLLISEKIPHCSLVLLCPFSFFTKESESSWC